MEYHEVTGNQKGALGEALFSVTSVIQPIFCQWACRDLHQHEHQSPPNPDAIAVRRCSSKDFCNIDHHPRPVEGEPGWIIDTHIEVGPAHEDHHLPGEPSYHYLLEIKTGTSSTLGDNQCRAMEQIEREDDRRIPVRARVDVNDLPDRWGVAFTRIHDRW